MKQRILLIEDNEQNRYLVKFILETHGYEVLQAKNGQEGIEMANSVDPALILLDIQLPGLDGFTVAQRLRDFDTLATVPIVAITSYAMVGDKERILAAGCTGYMEKPINPETFVADIETYLLK